MTKIKVGLLSKKRGNYKLQQKFSGKETIYDETAKEIAHHRDALIRAGFEVIVIEWDIDFIDRLKHADIQLVFNVSSLVEAAILEECGIPYVGSGPLGIVAASDKSLAKRLWEKEEIPTSEFRVLRNIDDCQAFISKPPFPYPIFIKPVAGRGSAGITNNSLIQNNSQLIENTKILLETIGQPVLVERFLTGREVTIGVLGNGKNIRTMPPLEITFKKNNGFLTFNKKEADDDTFICPANISSAEEKCLKDLAIRAFTALGLRDFARIDTKLTPQGFMLLEANSFAGLTCTPKSKPKSYIGFMARAEGIGAKELFQEIIKIALERINN